MTKKILIVAGEPSGDLHASNLVKDLKRLYPDIRFFGLGGSMSKEAGVDVIYDIAALALIGLVEVLRNIFTVGRVFKKVLSAVDTERPDLAILVDYPGFNLRLAKELKKRSIPVVYYISPQVWAWGMDRVKSIKKCVDKVICLFKFEEAFYKTYGIDAEFIGHPLLDTVKVTAGRGETLEKHSLNEDKLTVAILPGSRTNEVRSLLPAMLGAAMITNLKLPETQFIVVKHPDLPSGLYRKMLRYSSINIRLSDGDAYNVLGASDFAFVASGTATLETAIIGTPLAITYKVNLLTYLVYKMVSKTRFIGIVNIIAGREIVPELLQFRATAKNLAEAALNILTSEENRSSTIEELKQVRNSLGSPLARERAAKAVLPFLTTPKI
ncbi:MAG: lipid-A-disaccharide synthase [Candidatus Omnitrophota bacterium]|jgi:lipid-A-disaccharide synthase